MSAPTTTPLGRYASRTIDGLTSDEVWQIANNGKSRVLTAQEFGVTETTVNAIRQGRVRQQDSHLERQQSPVATGTANGQSKLTEQEVLEIFHAVGYTNRALGAKYGVSGETCRMIRNGERYRSITGATQLDEAAAQIGLLKAELAALTEKVAAQGEANQALARQLAQERASVRSLLAAAGEAGRP